MEIEWRESRELVPYPEAMEWMEARVAAILAGLAGPCIWLLEHPPLYTAGSSAKLGDLLADDLLGGMPLPVYATGRGGQYTYHGPGQRVAYVMMDLKALFAPAGPDLRAYVGRLEKWIIAALAEFGVEGFTRPGRTGVWIQMTADGGQLTRKNLPAVSRQPSSDLREAKIAAIGVRVRKWVAYHGIAINVRPDLAHYAGIVPCGIREFGVTSLHALGTKATLAGLDDALKKNIAVLLG